MCCHFAGACAAMEYAMQQVPVMHAPMTSMCMRSKSPLRPTSASPRTLKISALSLARRPAREPFLSSASLSAAITAFSKMVSSTVCCLVKQPLFDQHINQHVLHLTAFQFIYGCRHIVLAVPVRFVLRLSSASSLQLRVSCSLYNMCKPYNEQLLGVCRVLGYRSTVKISYTWLIQGEGMKSN